ncbi:MAG: RNA chaperone Hfq [Acidobacteria bacterium]|nr:RNA chaperone Hfq [Acidobacteriota bacterium]
MLDTPRKESHHKDHRPKEAPAAVSQNNIQDVFLNNLRKERTVVTVFLTGGVKLTGKIRSFDKYALVLETNNQEQLVFKHAISTVVVARASQSVSQPVQQVAEA